MSHNNPNELDWLRTLTKRLKQGEATTIIAETLTALEHQPDNLESLLTSTTAYTWLGDGSAAEPYARQALDVVRQRGKAEKGDYWYPRYVDLAHIGVYDVLMPQRRFQEAARWLDAHAKRAIQTNMWLAITAFAYFVAGDTKATRRAMRRWLHQDPYESTDYTSEQLDVSAKFRVMAGYIDLQTYPPGPLRQLLRIWRRRSHGYWDDELAVWDDEARRNAHNPYGARLVVILNDLRAFLR